MKIFEMVTFAVLLGYAGFALAQGPDFSDSYTDENGCVIFENPTYDGVQINSNLKTTAQWALELGFDPDRYMVDRHFRCFNPNQVANPPSYTQCTNWGYDQTAGFNYDQWEVHDCAAYGWMWDHCYLVITDVEVCHYKDLTAGPDEDLDGDIDLAVPIKTSEGMDFQWRINWQQPGAPDVLIVDTAPAESIVTAINGDPTGLPVDCGNSTFFNDLAGHTEVYRGGKSGKTCRSATQIEWTPASDSETLVVDVSMRESPGMGHKGSAIFAPTSCGALELNKGAVVFELDPATGEPLTDPATGEPLPPLVETDGICVAAVEDLTAPVGIEEDGHGDEDQDLLNDFTEACVVGTDPCDPDHDKDGVIDGLDECPFEGAANPLLGQLLEDGCIRQSQCSDGQDNDNDGPIDFPADDSCDGILDDTEDSPVGCPCFSIDQVRNLGEAFFKIAMCYEESTVDSLGYALAGIIEPTPPPRGSAQLGIFPEGNCSYSYDDGSSVTTQLVEWNASNVLQAWACFDILWQVCGERGDCYMYSECASYTAP